MFDSEELLEWEYSQYVKRNFKNVKVFKNPRLEKLKDFRKGLKSAHFDKDEKACRKEHHRKYRREMKRLIQSENYELIRKYHKTSGWLTW